MRRNLSSFLFLVCVLLVAISFAKSIFNSLGKKDENGKIFNELTKTILNTKTKESYSVWIPSWKVEKSILSIEKVSNKISYAMPVVYTLNSNGEVDPIDFDKYSELKTKLKDKNINLMPTLTNITKRGFDANLVTLFLENQEENSLKLVQLARENGYTGYDIDFELIYKSDRQSFTDFISYFSKILHQNNMLISVTLHAQNGKTDSKVSAGQDLKSLSSEADFVRIMAYDFHNLETEAGPITPQKDLIDVIEYSKTVVDIEKLAICLPLYGYEWNVVDGGGKPIEFDDINKSIFDSVIEPERDDESWEMTYEHDGRVAWYQDAQSVKKKIELAKSYGIKNFCFWSLGGEDASLWDIL